MRITMFNHAKLKAKMYNGESVQYLHEKFDGHRLTILAQPPRVINSMMAVTRQQTDLWPLLTETAKVHNIWPWLVNLTRLQQRSSIDGELYVPGRPASYIKTAIKEHDPELQFVAFAIPYVNGERMFHKSLEWAMQFCSERGIHFSDFIKFDDPSIVDVEKALNICPAEREGYVAKLGNYAKWYKIKRVHTIDLVVTSIKPGKGKYEGQCGALVCSVFTSCGSLVEICACSGMTDDQRRTMGLDDIGRVVEVKYQEVASVGRLRHPNFVQWRPDKQQAECTVSQDLELLRYWS